MKPIAIRGMKIRRKEAVALALVAALLGTIVFLLSYSMTLKKEIKSLKSKRDEIVVLRADYQSLKSRVDALDARKSLTRVGGIVEASDNVFRSIGLNRKVKSVKPISSKEVADGIEEEAEIQVERVSLNEMVNIFHRFDTAPMLFSVRKTTIKTTFEDPSLLTLSVTAALIRPK